MQKGQKMRFSDRELSVMKGVFAENPELLIRIRKALLQAELTVEDKKALTEIFAKDSENYKVLGKIFNPKLELDAPIHQIVDMWYTAVLKDKSTDFAIVEILSKQLFCAYLDQVMNDLVNESTDENKIIFANLIKIDLSTQDERDVHVNVYTRNAILAHVEAHLQQTFMLAGTKQETVEDTQKRLLQNSTK